MKPASRRSAARAAHSRGSGSGSIGPFNPLGRIAELAPRRTQARHGVLGESDRRIAPRSCGHESHRSEIPHDRHLPFTGPDRAPIERLSTRPRQARAPCARRHRGPGAGRTGGGCRLRRARRRRGRAVDPPLRPRRRRPTFRWERRSSPSPRSRTGPCARARNSPSRSRCRTALLRRRHRPPSPSSSAANRCEDREELTAWLAGENEGVALAPVGSTTLEPVPPQSQQVNGIVRGARTIRPWPAGRRACMRCRRRTSRRTVRSSSTSAMIVPAMARPPSASAWSCRSPRRRSRTDCSPRRAHRAHRPGGLARDQLDAVDGTAAILAVDPAIAAAIRVLGTSAPPDGDRVAGAARSAAEPALRPPVRRRRRLGPQLQSGLSAPDAPDLAAVAPRSRRFVPPEPTPTPEPDRNPDPGRAGAARPGRAAGHRRRRGERLLARRRIRDARVVETLGGLGSTTARR